MTGMWIGYEWDMNRIWLGYELDMNGIWIGNDELDMNGIWIGWSALTWSSNLDVLLYKIPSEPQGSRNASIATLSRCRSRSSLWEEDWSSMLQLGDGSWAFCTGSRAERIGGRESEPFRDFPESILKGTNLASVWIWRDEAGVLSNSLHSFTLSKKVAANALHVRVVWTACIGFLWKPQCKSWNLRRECR